MPSIYSWSLVAANNANADSTINWAEGQVPSTVNGSARQMMARIKSLLNDLSGVPVATGTANAIIVTTSTGFDALADGLRMSFRAASTNTGAVTLNTNSLGSKPTVKFTASGGTALSAGEIQQDGIYEAVYCSHLNGASGAWLLLNPTAVSVFPGTGAPFFGGTVPPGWLLCDGAAVSRTTYAGLFAAIGTTWGAGNGSTTFNLPDGRNDFLRGASGTIPLGTRQSDEIKSHIHTGSTEAAGGHHHTGQAGDPFDEGGIFGRGASSSGPISVNTSTAPNHVHPFTTSSTGGPETRPRNIAVHWIIKT